MVRPLSPRGVLEPVAFLVALEDVATMSQPIESRSRQPLKAQHLGPLLEGQVRVTSRWVRS